MTSNACLKVWKVRCNVQKFVSKFVPIIYDDSIVSNLIGWLIKVANHNEHPEFTNKHSKSYLKSKLKSRVNPQSHLGERCLKTYNKNLRTSDSVRLYLRCIL